MREIVYSPEAGLPIVDDNVIQFPRPGAQPIPDPTENFAERMTICADLPAGKTAGDVIDQAKREELRRLKESLPEIYDPI
jgi:hypothetical protein